MTRAERIRFLLDHYQDVLSGLWDLRAQGGGVPVMCTVWNSASYQELERLIPLLRVDRPRLYRAVMGLYVEPRFVRRAVCPKCQHVAPPRVVGELHAHHTDAQWRGDPSVPAELLPLVAVA